MIKGLMRQVGAMDELLEQQEELLVQEKKIAKNSRSSWHLKKVRWRSLTRNLLKARRLLVVKSLIGALQGQHDALLKTH
jgi:hypothetical protein